MNQYIQINNLYRYCVKPLGIQFFLLKEPTIAHNRNTFRLHLMTKYILLNVYTNIF